MKSLSQLWEDLRTARSSSRVRRSVSSRVRQRRVVMSRRGRKTDVITKVVEHPELESESPLKIAMGLRMMDLIRDAGGKGSGNYGHAGRPGAVGGSGEGIGGIKEREWKSCTVGEITFSSADDERTEVRVMGGAGSGNFGHAGRPGAVGGSGESASFEAFGRIKARREELKRQRDEAFAKTGIRETANEQKIRMRQEATDKGGQGETPQEKRARVDQERGEQMIPVADLAPQPLVREPTRDPEPKLGVTTDEPVADNPFGFSKAIGLKARLERSTEKLKDLKDERLHVINPDGSVAFALQGTPGRVRVSGDQLRALEKSGADFTLIHNHPGHGGSSLSHADLVTSSMSGIKSIIAVTKDGCVFRADMNKKISGETIKRALKQADSRIIAFIGRPRFGKSDDLYRVYGHMVNLSLDKQGLIKYHAKLSPQFQAALKRSSFTEPIKKGLGL